MALASCLPGVKGGANRFRFRKEIDERAALSDTRAANCASDRAGSRETSVESPENRDLREIDGRSNRAGSEIQDSGGDPRCVTSA
jgi:hypothetical protein